MTEIENIAALQSYVGKEVAVSDWLEVPQERITQFADATEDRQWIHVDPERAAAESPYKGPIAHGFLTLSLLSILARRSFSIGNVRVRINYGLDRVRFVAPVPAGAHIRGTFVLASAKAITGGIQATWKVKIECRDSGTCCLAEWLVRYLA
jgi:acyl dehydratase